ncbi:MAG: efflux transporter outer membrane subunit [Comamonas sp.]
MKKNNHLTSMRARCSVLCAALACAGLLAACSVAPPYQAPAVEVPASFKEAGASWNAARPADAIDRGAWWEIFGDATLDGLAQQVQISNQNIAAAVAAVDQARALVRVQAGGRLPSLGLSVGASREGGGDTARGTSTSLGLNAAWDADLWGRLREGVNSATRSAQASEADLAAARLSAVGTLVQNYFRLREADAELGVLAATVEAYQRSLQITQNRYDSGIAAKTDVLQAQTQLASTRASLEAMRQTRRTYEHALAMLTGQPPAGFALAATPWAVTVPEVPAVLPSTLLERRPDIAGAERAVAAANAQIGVARAAYYPSLSLSGSLGQSGSNLGDLLSASGLLWSLGASVAQTLFNGGATTAQVDAARAAHAQKTAVYRQTVLAAFQAVEDALGQVQALGAQQPQLQQALEAADKVEQQMLNRYKEGIVQYTDVVTAQVTALNARRSLLQLQMNQQIAAANLVQQIGGGWHMPWLEQK